MKSVLFIWLITFATLAGAQTKRDSILRVLPEMKEDTLKLNAYMELQNAYHREDINIALEYAEKAQALAANLGFKTKRGRNKMAQKLFPDPDEAI